MYVNLTYTFKHKMVIKTIICIFESIINGLTQIYKNLMNKTKQKITNKIK